MKKIVSILSLVLVASLTLAGCKSGINKADEVIGASVIPQKNEIETSPPATEELEWDKIPMVMVDGKLYYDTGKESTISGRCGVMDGEITSTVDGSEIPAKDDQSNFGTGFEYQYGADNTIEIFMNEKWIVFEQREEAGNQVRFGDRMVDADGLSEETLEWLDWYNHLSAEEQLAVSAVPSDLLEDSGPAQAEDAESSTQEDEKIVTGFATGTEPEEGCYISDCDEILKIEKTNNGTYNILEYGITHLLYVENAVGNYNSETGLLEFSGKDDMGNDIKAEIKNMGDHLEVTVTHHSRYEGIIGTKQDFFQEDE